MSVTDRLVAPLARRFYQNYMKPLGIANYRALSKAYNSWRYRRRASTHREAFANELETLLNENGPGWQDYNVTLNDGWALDRSGTLPHLDELLKESAGIIAERGGKKHSSAQQPYFRSLSFEGDDTRYPSLLNFVLSSQVLKIACEHLGTVPILSKTRPPGWRMMESNAKLDTRPNPVLTESQFFHLDLHDSPLLYVIVLLDEVTEECGPWSFLPQSVSTRAAEAMGYQRRGSEYRVTDELMYSHVSREDLIVFTGKPGDVLFIDSSKCFHYGSRNAQKPRFLMMYAYTTPCRADMTLTFMQPMLYPRYETDSRIRRMVLDAD